MRWKAKIQAGPSSRLTRLTDHDLFLLAEAEIMNAGQELSRFADTGSTDYLNYGVDHLHTAISACEEIKGRST